MMQLENTGYQLRWAGGKYSFFAFALTGVAE